MLYELAGLPSDDSALVFFYVEALSGLVKLRKSLILDASNHLSYRVLTPVIQLCLLPFGCVCCLVLHYAAMLLVCFVY